MNTGMYNHPITIKQLDILKEWHYNIINPKEQILACGEYGIGAMENVNLINQIIIEKLLIRK